MAASKKKPMYIVLHPDGESWPLWTSKDLDEFVAEESNYNAQTLPKYRIFKLGADTQEFKYVAPKVEYTLEEVK